MRPRTATVRARATKTVRRTLFPRAVTIYEQSLRQNKDPSLACRAQRWDKASHHCKPGTRYCNAARRNRRRGAVDSNYPRGSRRASGRRDESGLVVRGLCGQPNVGTPLQAHDEPLATAGISGRVSLFPVQGAPSAFSHEHVRSCESGDMQSKHDKDCDIIRVHLPSSPRVIGSGCAVTKHCSDEARIHHSSMKPIS